MRTALLDMRLYYIILAILKYIIKHLVLTLVAIPKTVFCTLLVLASFNINAA